MAPEMINNKSCSDKIDIWGAGCIFLYLMTGKMPLNSDSVDNSELPYDFVNIEESKLLETLEENAKNLLKGMLALN